MNSSKSNPSLLLSSNEHHSGINNSSDVQNHNGRTITNNTRSSTDISTSNSAVISSPRRYIAPRTTGMLYRQLGSSVEEFSSSHSNDLFSPFSSTYSISSTTGGRDTSTGDLLSSNRHLKYNSNPLLEGSSFDKAMYV